MSKLDHVEFLVEELSMEVTLRTIVPAIVPEVSFEVRTFNGKPDLLSNLPDRLRGYQAWSRVGGLGVVVVVDRDDDDCRELMEQLDAHGLALGFHLTSVASGVQGNLLNRVVIEELEAWFLGDSAALCSAFQGVPPSFRERRAFRDPDAVSGGTAEAMARLIRSAGHHRGGLRKVAAARDIAHRMDPELNDSKSFQKFRDGLRLIVNGAA